MDPQEVRARAERDQQQVRRELERKSHDLWRIYNPLDETVNVPKNGDLKIPYVENGTFVFFYDGYPIKIASHAFKDIEFFKVRRFFSAISNFMISQLQEIKQQELIKKHEEMGQGGYLDKYMENMDTWMKVPTLNDRTLLEQIADQVVIGLVEEYGLDLQPASHAPVASADTRSLHDQVLGVFSKKIAPEVQAAKEELKPQ